MPSFDLIDHSPQHPSPATSLVNASNLVLIDNYDSFTWNVYQYLVLEGATVTVHRNDKVTVQELIAQEPTQLVISPGPGHPDTDSGVSQDAIKHFAGKIPVLGVCMGEYYSRRSRTDCQILIPVQTMHLRGLWRDCWLRGRDSPRQNIASSPRFERCLCKPTPGSASNPLSFSGWHTSYAARMLRGLFLDCKG